MITVLRYCAAAWSNVAFAASSRCSSVPPWKIGCVTLPATLQNPVPDANSWSTASAVLPAVAGQRDVRQPVGDGDADLRAGGLQVGLGGADVRPLLDQLATAG